VPLKSGLAYRRILLKLSGEALMGDLSYGISPDVMDEVAKELALCQQKGAELAIVVGGGNIFRGVSGAAHGMDRAAADQMGMLATVINALALQDALERQGAPAHVMSAIEVGKMAEPFIRRRALHLLDRKRIVILAAGTGNPFFTTDTASALRALEVQAEILFKATKVDGIYDKDPMKFPDAKRFDQLTYHKVMEMGLQVMDMAAVSLAQEAGLPVMVFNMLEPGNILKAISGEKIGTVVTAV